MAEPVPVSEPAPVPESAAEPVLGGREPEVEPARGKHARSAPPTAAAAEAMLAELRAQSADPVLAKMGGRLKDPGFRLMVMVGGTLTLAATLFAAYAVLGLVLG